MKRENLRLPFEVKRIKRRPGQSVGEHWRALVEKEFYDVTFFVTCGLVFLLLAFFQYTGIAIPIWLGVILFIIGIAVAMWRLIKIRCTIDKCKLGENGEQYVGQILEAEMRPLGYDVFHDIPIEKAGRKMNLDHVLIGPNGVYLVETKAWRKPEKGSPEIEYKYKGGVLYKAGRRVPDKPITEAIALAKEASRLFHDITGRNYYVKPILVFAGWYHRVGMTHDSPILFLNEKSIASFLPKHVPMNIPSQDDCNLLRAKLSLL